MSDGIAITAGAGTTVATDDIGGVHYQRVKLSLGADGTANDASAGAGAVGTGTQRVTLASDDPLVAKVPASLGGKGRAASLAVAEAHHEYETVAASATAQALGATGVTGDYLSHVLVQPTSTTVGVVTILDNAVEVHAYPGGTVGADLKPWIIPVGAASVSGAWKITTGAGVKCTAFGDFT